MRDFNTFQTLFKRFQIDIEISMNSSKIFEPKEILLVKVCISCIDSKVVIYTIYIYIYIYIKLY